MRRTLITTLLGILLMSCTGIETTTSLAGIGIVKEKGFTKEKIYSPVTHTYSFRESYWVILKDQRRFPIAHDEYLELQPGDTLKFRTVIPCPKQN